MHPSPSSSALMAAFRLRAWKHAGAFVVGTMSCLSLDWYVASVQVAEEEAAMEAMAGGESRLREHIPFGIKSPLFLKTLHGADGDSILFVGNSIMASTAVTSVLHDQLDVASRVRVGVLTLPSPASATVLRALVLADRTPGTVVVDLAPRNMRPADENRALVAARSASFEPTSRGTGRVDGLKSTVREAVATVFPRAGQSGGAQRYLSAVSDGLRYGFDAYRHASFGNVISARMPDGTTRVTVLNRTPGYASARAGQVARSRALLKKSQRLADAAVESILDSAGRLAERGCRVILVNLPLDPELRSYEQDLNGERWRRLASTLQGNEDIRFIDLHADARLLALPCYDGHHREYPVAVETSRIIGEILRPQVPERLRNER